MTCTFCGEEILPGEGSHKINDGRDDVHAECMFRMVLGSAEHIRQQCSCFGGSSDEPDGLSLRESAKRAYAAAREFIVRPVAKRIMSEVTDAKRASRN